MFLAARQLLTKPIWLRCFSSSSNLGCYDIVIVGGGIVGVAAARELAMRDPSLKCAILEKECELAKHQTGHNSGVIHAGIYYKPGSVRAKMCVQGFQKAYEYAAAKNVPYKKVGKLIVATNKDEEGTLMNLFERGQKNGVPDLCIVDGKDIGLYEPYCQGTLAMYSPHTGIIDWAEFTRVLGDDFRCCGGHIFFGFKVNNIEITPESIDESVDINKYPVVLKSSDNRTINAGVVLTCGGLQSDKIAKLTGGGISPAILPVRGEYLQLVPERRFIVRGNIYPVPDPRLPFLGVHFTPTMSGSVLIGPNAVLAGKREGYRMSQINVGELMETLTFKGTRVLMSKYFSYGLDQFMSSIFITRQLKELQKYLPCIQPKDIMRGPAGVRAQALSHCGDFVDDFVFEDGKGAAADLVLHCRNAPSPGATASLAIAEVLTEKVLNKLCRVESKRNSPLQFVNFKQAED